MSNLNTVRCVGLPHVKQSLEQFDLLPREVKEVIWNLPFKAVWTRPGPISLAAIERALTLFAKSTAEVYGFDHPDAAKFVATLPELDF